MAKIQQAVRWMEEGFGVQRDEFKDGPNDVYIWREDTGFTDLNYKELMFTLGDILADDWEITAECKQARAALEGDNGRS